MTDSRDFDEPDFAKNVAMRRYLPPDSGITVEQFANEIIGMLDRR
jgi:hypothetical protein